MAGETVASKNGKRHYSAATMAKMRERGRALAKKHGFKKGHGAKRKKKA